MAIEHIELTIRDGDPIWASPDIWVVPGTDPNGPPGQPHAGEENFVWARVTNNGTRDAVAATVEFYWANPSTVITPITANRIGITSPFSLPSGGGTIEVYCLATWIPEWVNNGHECLIAVASAPGDLVVQRPNEPFELGDRHIAQLNVNVVYIVDAQIMASPFFVFNPDEKNENKFRLGARQVDIKTLEPILKTLGLKSLPKEDIKIEKFGLNPYRCGDPLHETGKAELILELAAGQHKGMALVAEVPKNLASESGALFLVEQYMDKKLLGGIAVLFIGSEAMVRS